MTGGGRRIASLVGGVNGRGVGGVGRCESGFAKVKKSKVGKLEGGKVGRF
jgi:hypothetical protein